ncbi:MAG: hypothetical protein AAFV53_26010 [Myxococcota bacterium]
MSVLYTVLGGIPVLILFLIGGALSIVNWSHHPAAARLSLVGVCLLTMGYIVERVGFGIITTGLVEALPEVTLSWILGGIGLLTSFINMAGVLSIAAATWSNREAPT